MREGHNKDVAAVMARATLSDWFLLISLAKNMEINVFTEFIGHLVPEDAVDDCGKKELESLSPYIEEKVKELVKKKI